MQESLDSKFAVELLLEMLGVESITCNEENRSCMLYNYLSEYKDEYGFDIKRIGNNLILTSQNMEHSSPTLLMVSHIDTVPPTTGYSFNPIEPFIKNNKIFGLGSNDDGGCVVCMITSALNYYQKCKRNTDNNTYTEVRPQLNLVLILSAEEEKSGKNGLSLVLESYKSLDFAIVGEPTGLNMAIGERGLLVIDCVAIGKAGHAARDEGDNAIYKAIDDINKLRNLSFPKKSPLFGDIKINTTIFNSGSVHNIVPSEAKFTVDIRTTECYSNKELVEIISEVVESRVIARNLNNRSSVTPQDNGYGTLLLRAGSLIGLKSFLSPTTSDWMRLDIPAVKVGPGDSSRSHKADEYITINEIENGIETYTKYIEEINKLI